MLQYLFKFSISLVVMFIFYRAVLRPLTFFQWNRFYLLCYTLLSFIIPFINITPWVSKEGVSAHELVTIIPAIDDYTAISAKNTPFLKMDWAPADWLLIIFSAGAVIMLMRLAMQYRSLRRIRHNAVLLNETNNVQLYQTDAPISPFSFGKAIYINKKLHTREELERIIQHEFVHVKQKHSADLLLGELLCVVNWFNPFAWLTRHAIRQNLEFIADDSVVANGLDKKEYQYLLLKVVGIPQYSIASNFNFSNLKKRIAMMNKLKSAKLQLSKFLFVLPLLAVSLLAFRNGEPAAISSENLSNSSLRSANYALDTTPVSTGRSPVAFAKPSATANSKGYIITVADNEGEHIVLVKNTDRKIVKAVPLAEWNNHKKQYEDKYGKMHPVFPGKVDSIAASKSAKKGEGSLLTLSKSNHPEHEPLYIIEGKPQTDDFSLANVDPKNIESIEVVKNKAAVDKYGDRAINGVIIVGMKKGLPLKSIDTLNHPHRNAALTVHSDSVNGTASMRRDTGSRKGFDNLSQLSISNPTGHPPLYVIDGVEHPDGVRKDELAPNSIRSITILKDESSEIMYGERGRYGVIIVETKEAWHRRHSNDSATIKADSITYNNRNQGVNGAKLTRYHVTGIAPAFTIPATNTLSMLIMDGVEIPLKNLIHLKKSSSGLASSNS